MANTSTTSKGDEWTCPKCNAENEDTTVCTNCGYDNAK